MIDRPKFKEIAYEVKGKGTVMPYKDVEDIYDTVELKMDGIWGVFICDKYGYWEIQSRTGKIKKEGHTEREGCWGATIIGEFMHGSHWAHQRGWDGKFFAYDMLHSETTIGGPKGDMKEWHFIKRRGKLRELIKHRGGKLVPDFMHLNHSNPVRDWAALWDGYVQDEGYEGLVFKKNDERWDESTWARMKAKAEIDYICMGFAMGGEDTKYKDTVGSILGGLRNADGDMIMVCKVGGLTEAQRDFFRDNQDYFIGKVFTSHGYCFYPSGAIRHAKFKVFRKDKTAYECTFEQIPDSYSIKASPSGKTTEAFERDAKDPSRIDVTESYIHPPLMDKGYLDV